MELQILIFVCGPPGRCTWTIGGPQTTGWEPLVKTETLEYTKEQSSEHVPLSFGKAPEIHGPKYVNIYVSVYSIEASKFIVTDAMQISQETETFELTIIRFNPW